MNNNLNFWDQPNCHWDDTAHKDGSGQRVTKELVRQFAQNLFEHLEEASDLLDVFAVRPQERWLYGLVSRSLEHNILTRTDFLLTEVPVPRNGGNGRVDFMFSYRNWLFLLELKATGCGAIGRGEIPSGHRVCTHWADGEQGAVSQLRTLTAEDMEDFMSIARTRKLRGIIRLPVLLCSYFVTSSKEDDGRWITEKVKEVTPEDLYERHAAVKTAIRSSELAAFIARPPKKVEPRRGKKVEWRATVGYGLFAGAMDFLPFQEA